MTASGTVLVTRAFDHVEVLCLGHIERAQNEGIHHRKYYRVCSDSEGQSQDGDSSKIRRLAQLTDADAKVLPEGFEKISAESFVALLLEANEAAELYACAALGLSTETPERSISSARCWICERSSSSISVLIWER